MKVHEKFMSRCVSLARNGLGTTYPNPLVGSVVVRDGQIIGEGWHYKAGEPHAEVVAIKRVKDKEWLKESTLYVNLEPCSHHGRTPPCTDLITSVGIRRVVVGSVDPNPQVSGRGIKKLEQAGCQVLTGVMEEACEHLNRRFFTFHREGRPYIQLKWAQTADGYMAAESQPDNSGPVWISNKYSRQHAHKLRAQTQAILVGSRTVQKDDPSLTTRLWEGASPVRVVLDPEGVLTARQKVFDEQAPTFYFSDAPRQDLPGVTQFRLLPKASGLEVLCDVLYRQGIQSLLVEGGPGTLQGFIDSGLWDEAFIYRGTAVWGKGMPAPQITGKQLERKQLDADILERLKNHHT